jgi:FixJ family two-component response regulator
MREGAEVQSVLLERHASLNAGERAVMDLVVAGLLNKQIASELSLSEVTIKVRRGHVMRKMGASSLADLVRYAGRIDGSDQRVLKLKS